MKKFRYKYENILKLKEKEEDRVKNDMAKINGLLMAAHERYEVATNEENEYLKSIDLLMKNGCTAMELRGTQNNKAYLKKRIEEEKGKINYFEDLLSQKKVELVEAMKERKIYEKLKEKEFESYQENVKASEEKLVDQIVSYNSRK